MKYKHIIFDVDGTLLDTEFAVLHSLQDTVMQYSHISIPIDKLCFALGIPGKVALERLGIEDTIGANEYWNEMMQKYHKSIGLFDGINDTLSALRDKGYRLGIITSKTKSEFEMDFVPHGISHYFDSIICVDDSPKPKPYPDPILTYLNRNQILASEAIYIGDTEYDSLCAHSAGVDFGLALWGCRNSAGINSEYRFNTPNEIVIEYGQET
ncbi:MULTISPECIES: HAD family hydrolase [Bacteroidaceae]|jgi:HAD superfamily hydrolase (TIGR01549 family)|uniref:HAD family hydrolase n=1 Tax=Phocaeicola plebeius TaxID=310297 RepID=A0A414WSA0_9BACT|nr:MULTISPECIES: HAD family hydrolase [Bacteroidaceae]MBQ4532747.1 HAD family hydrolase [Alistipes sp.]MCF2581485.1 HAD family hydrolase [Bacteroides caecigallinarum]RHD48640.1 HAD family hydrolase [Phocaeicola plebeius]RHH40176.1 HAD family hydrolase [Phocaeicola plebeius]RHK99307.1 HAD family hydrolase [Phocaeicola plebeius]